jgi:hypothetical protein
LMDDESAATTIPGSFTAQDEAEGIEVGVDCVGPLMSSIPACSRSASAPTRSYASGQLKKPSDSPQVHYSQLCDLISE